MLEDFAPACPFPIQNYPYVLLAHGGGGKLMQQLIERMFTSAFGPAPKDGLHDSVSLELPGKRIAFTTDSFVVRPLFFPGGDIGTLAVYGTVNDLAMSGAKPLYLSLGFIIEEGLPMETLWQVVRSIKKSADLANVKIVTGDTKVVDKGKGDGIYINTSGIGVIEHSLNIVPGAVKEGDAVIISGDVGRHGMAIMATRENLEFESTIESDCAPLAEVVLQLLDAGVEIHCMRDLTRGGLASALNEIAASSHLGINIEESLVPVREDVNAACAIMGFDALYVANEGRFVLFCPAQDQLKVLEIMQRHPQGQGACVIGSVQNRQQGDVVIKSKIGINRLLDMISGEQLPRIC